MMLTEVHQQNTVKHLLLTVYKLQIAAEASLGIFNIPEGSK